MDLSLQGRVPLVVASSKGPGKAVTEQFALEGCNNQLARYGSRDELAMVVAYLVSDASSYVTGSSFMVDGEMVKAY